MYLMCISTSISTSIYSPCSNHPRRIIAATCTSASNPLPILCFRCTPSLCHLSLSVRARAPIPSSPRAGCVAQLRLVAAASCINPGPDYTASAIIILALLHRQALGVGGICHGVVGSSGLVVVPSSLVVLVLFFFFFFFFAAVLITIILNKY